MKKAIFSILAILLGLSLGLLWACGDDDDDDDNDEVPGDDDSDDDTSVQDDDSDNDDDMVDSDDDTYSNECEGNVAPELLGLTVVVNGDEVAMPVTVQLFDELAIRFEYADEDCNLEGGAAFILEEGSESILEDPDWEFVGIDCSSEDAGEPYEIPMDPGIFIEADGPFKLEIMDNCGDASGQLALDITYAIGK